MHDVTGDYLNLRREQRNAVHRVKTGLSIVVKFVCMHASDQKVSWAVVFLGTKEITFFSSLLAVAV
jgi:hypothetical protein